MEIKPQELRIGNFVKWGVHECIIKGIHTDTVTGKDPYVYGSVMIGAMPIYTIEGIALTPEWLERAGFEYEKQTNGGYERWEIKTTKGRRIKLLDKKFTWCAGEYSDYILYVHQLQNLFFALTGKELAIDNKSI